ncbi:hypothetical protein [Arenibaculum pallidiluteum]|uniref:hypothetical protein n=1 Tax=Arenibaculum pallidiluteum TaxID=2812559 RepID=UPI001A9653AB|nr:hypothetical protein [Arenibaculum pallidiluteum]
MDNGTRIGRSGNTPVRPDIGRGRPAAPGGAAEPLAGGPAPRGQRIPSLRQIASLLIDGVLTLPRGYRRGTYLDLLV